MLPTDELGSAASASSASARLLGGATSSAIQADKRTLALAASYLLLLAVGWLSLPLLLSASREVTCSLGGRPIVDVFPGAPYRTAATVSARLLLSDGRNRVESHTVRGEDGRLYRDWLWMDVVDQINVVPFVLPPPDAAASPAVDASGRRRSRLRDGHFLVFRQRKYGLADESLAVCGGQIEMATGEQPLAAAQRELREEMALVGSQWVDLGSYRVNVNRGHGVVSCFLLLDARSDKADSDAAGGADGGFAVDELERQSVVRLSLADMERAVQRHEFAEIKWQATAVMALQAVQARIEQEERGDSESQHDQL